jgi:hypothetical protein
MKYINEIAVTICVVVMVGCSPADDRARDSAGRIETSLPEVCLNGVVYYYHGDGAYNGWGFSPKFKPDSTVETCE